jgi:hypothetical protein
MVGGVSVGASSVVSVAYRSRPVRLAFLVRPNNVDDFSAAVEASTCLWGGQFNAIIPVYHSTPRWWSDVVKTPPSAKAIMRGYLSAFEPDYAVRVSDEVSIDLDLEKWRI